MNRFGGPGNDLACPNASQLAAFERVVRLGDIGWHAFPFNAEPELYDPGLFQAALDLTFAEDDHYNHPHRMTLSQRDVPGLTRAAIPLLAASGVKAVSVGENRDLKPVNVPPIFRWHDAASNTSLIALFHAGGYGASDTDAPEGLYVNAADGEVKGYPFGGDCVEVPAARTALCYAWKQDNQGPHGGAEALAIFKGVEHIYPNAMVHASDAFDDFVTAVSPHAAGLPVVTAEIGDTWIQGASADPRKMATFRAISRARAQCVAAGVGGCDPAQGSAEFRTFERLAVKAGEHTWGWDGAQIKSEAWSNRELTAALRNGTYFQTAVWTWLEQRSFLTNAVAALPPGSRLAVAIAAELAELEPRPFRAAGFVDVAAGPDGGYGRFSLGKNCSIGFDDTGAITSLIAPSGTSWAGPQNPIGRVWYQGLGFEDFTAFTSAYLKAFNGNFDKPGLNLTAISSNMTVKRFRRRDGDASSDGRATFLLDLAPAMDVVHMERGAPATVEMAVDARVTASAELELNITLQWHNKTACHAPETIWYSNVPRAVSATGWWLDKLGSAVNPLDANLTGADGCDPHAATCGVHLHAIQTGVAYAGPEGRAAFESTDTALVSVGLASPLPTPLTTPEPRGGIHFPLYGNVWNTNYPFWYPFVPEDTSSRFRFHLAFQ